jgi:hypothetical protein
MPGFDPTATRRLILEAVGDATGRDEPLPAVTGPERGEWELLLEEVERRLFWDADWEMADLFLDLPPDVARLRLDQYGIDPDYFVAVPADPDGQGVAVARRSLAQLTGRGRHAP